MADYNGNPDLDERLDAIRMNLDLLSNPWAVSAHEARTAALESRVQ